MSKIFLNKDQAQKMVDKLVAMNVAKALAVKIASCTTCDESDSIKFDMTMRRTTPEAVLFSAFAWAETPEGYEYWKLVANDIQNVHSVPETEFSLSQADVQFLVTVLRKSLKQTNDQLRFYKEQSAFYWTLSDKADPASDMAFKAFSGFNKRTKQTRSTKKKISTLLRTLKRI